MKTLTFYQFLDMIEKTHCTHYMVLNRKGYYEVFLGVPVRFGFLAFAKTRPFNFHPRLVEIIRVAEKSDLLPFTRSENVYSY